ncbi:MAG: DNA-binding winged helix-turn-helix (wHTH) protein, partial [Myxococcota bacterium]
MQETFWLGEVHVDLAAGNVQRGGEKVRLTRTEIALLTQLKARAPAVVPRRELLTEALGYADCVDSRAVHHAIARLRKKLEPDPLEPRFLVSVRGVGVRLVVDEALAERTRLHVRQYVSQRSTEAGAWAFDDPYVLLGRLPNASMLDRAPPSLAPSVEAIRAVVGEDRLAALCLPHAEGLSRLSALLAHREGAVSVVRLPGLRLALWVAELSRPRGFLRVDDRSSWLSGGVELR